jgi:hypothetical protein
LCIAIEQLAGIRQAHSARTALEQFDRKLVLKSLDLSADGTGCNAKDSAALLIEPRSVTSRKYRRAVDSIMFSKPFVRGANAFQSGTPCIAFEFSDRLLLNSMLLFDP